MGSNPTPSVSRLQSVGALRAEHALATSSSPAVFAASFNGFREHVEPMNSLRPSCSRLACDDWSPIVFAMTSGCARSRLAPA